MEYDRPSGLTFNSSALNWAATRGTTPASLAFVHKGDGIYEATLTPGVAGSYRILVTAGGVRNTSIAFQRTQTALLQAKP